ncbi:DUF6624 domain-containing protein [Spirosoma flavus]
MSLPTLKAQSAHPQGSNKLMVEWAAYLADKGRVADMDSLLPVQHYSLTDCKQLLNRLYENDQRYRDSLINGSQTKQKQNFYWRKIIANDKTNQALLTKIITRYGWPTIKQYGKQGSETAYLIVWHADVTYRRKYYPLIKQSFERGTITDNPLELAERLKH